MDEKTRITDETEFDQISFVDEGSSAHGSFRLARGVGRLGYAHQLFIIDLEHGWVHPLNCIASMHLKETPV